MAKKMSRRARFEAALPGISAAREVAEGLRDELEEWLKSMPENLRDGEKAAQLGESIDNLDEFIGFLEEAEDIEVEFPGMFG